ncbi:immunoglobulin-like and fibronectin type III domain-containing protein 1 [Xyrauchen texanus]|uniref:immunoglobulin-like and fibronectin type III domain-containing protein 1 n=1 Tax=Xyrauchen texanus TaxID=154827 RepID=UPI0022424289|nr:immunoglobulin-like and fibronectin type III domain-containing protein 1 [Xyrauchen texanus]
MKFRKSKDEEPTAPGQVAIRKRSRVPGVMITQFVEEIPEGKSHPDFTRKPIALTIQEGKFGFFKAITTGDPTPTVTWARNNGDISDPERYNVLDDPLTGEHQLQMPNVGVDQADTYKCFANNEFGRAVVTVTLNVIEVGFKKSKAMQESRLEKAVADLKKSLRTRADRQKEERKDGEVDDKFWELLLSADKKDYESICAEYGVTDFRWMLKKLNEKKKEMEEQRSQYVEHLTNLRHIEIKTPGCAEFEFEMALKDPNAKIFLFKDGVLVPFNNETDEKHSLRQVGRKFIFSVHGLNPEDAGLYQVDVEGVNVFSTDFKIPMVDFLVKIQEVKAVERQDAVFECVLSAPLPKISWVGKNASLVPGEKYDITVSEDMLIHRLVVKDCMTVDKGIYAAMAGIKSCNAWLLVDHPGVHFIGGLSDIYAIIGQTAELECKLSRENCDGIWYKDGKEITATDDLKIIKDGAFHKLIITNCTDEDNGKYRFEADGRKTEGILVVEDPPRLNPDDLAKFSEPVIIKVGQNAIFKLDFVGREPTKVQWYNEGEELLEDNHVKIERTSSHSRLLLVKCQRKDSGEIKLKLKNEFGTIEALSRLIVLAYPGPPSTPKVVSAFKNCITLSWISPANTGGTNIVGYNMDKRKRGSNIWGQVNPPDQPIKGKQYDVKDVVEGMEYEFRVSAINFSGAGEPSTPSEFVMARDPKKPPGKIIDLKVTDSTYTSLSLNWTKPKEEEGVQDEAKGYFVELRPAENTEWGRCNSNPLISTSYTILGLKSMAMYWVRVVATNEGGDGEPQDLDNYIIAMPPPVRPNFTDCKMKSFMVVRAENSARININFEASPMPTIIWLKDGMPVSKRVTVSNTDGTSQLLIPSAQRSDTGIYTIIVKNIVGQETFSVEIRVTDDPKPPGPVELEENVPGTLTVSWDSSPDEKRDDHLHYIVMKRDSIKRTWQTIAERLFNNNFTAVNIMPGREYNFRVYAKNDIGLSVPSKSQTWGVVRKKEKFSLNIAPSKPCNFDAAPIFTVPLKTHTSPEKYECYMSCAVRGDPTPYVTWYHNNVSLNTDPNYYICNSCGVCSLLILTVGARNNGEYKVVAENSIGRAECKTQLKIRE